MTGEKFRDNLTKMLRQFATQIESDEIDEVTFEQDCDIVEVTRDEDTSRCYAETGYRSFSISYKDIAIEERFRQGRKEEKEHGARNETQDPDADRPV